MQISVYTAKGTKSGSIDLPAGLFEAPINKGLMHLALVRQQSNRRIAIAHVKHRGEVVGSTRKIYQQKHTGNARRGPVRSPLMKGGGKSFGPRNDANFIKEMPKKMRRAALYSALSFKAKEGSILGLENYPDEVKTKTFADLFAKLPVQHGRKILFILPEKHRSFELSARNVPGVKVITAAYLNPEDILGSYNMVFFTDAIKVAENVFLAPVDRRGGKQSQDASETEAPKKKVVAKKSSVKNDDTKPVAKKKSKKETQPAS